MGYEIERKWMASKAPEFVFKFPHTAITQAYLCVSPTVRVRRDGDSYYLTYKGDGLIKREEYNLPLSAEAYERLAVKRDGILVEKERYRVPVEGGLTAEVDIFKGEHEGRVYVEVEFDSEEAADSFTAPEWFGTEVTGLKGYSNAALAGVE